MDDMENSSRLYNDINAYEPEKVIEMLYSESEIYPIFVCLYTTDNGYEKHAERLIKSLDKFKLSYYIEGHKTYNRKWDEITKYKPFVLLKVMNKYPERAVVWLDADSIMEKMPTHFVNIKSDFAVHYVNGRVLDSAVVYFKNTDISRNILVDWIKENDKYPVKFDQVNLAVVIKNKYKSNEEILPREYCCIFDHQRYKNLNWVISQWQASRQLKNKPGTS